MPGMAVSTATEKRNSYLHTVHQLAFFCTRTYNRILRPGMAQVIPKPALDDPYLRRSFNQLEKAINLWLNEQKVPA